MLSKVGALHPSYRRERYPIAHIPDGPDAGYIALTEVIDLDAALLIELDPNLRRTMYTACSQTIRRFDKSANADADPPVRI